MNLSTSLLRSVYAMLSALVPCYAPFSPFGLFHASQDVRDLQRVHVFDCTQA